MARPKKIRNITFTPTVLGFKPYGQSGTLKKKEPVFLFYEEYEALRLCDYEKHNQQTAARLMEVSRPTLTRIYISAREKIAKSFVEGRQIIVEGGKVTLGKEWHHCNSCKAYFNFPYKNKEFLRECPVCKTNLPVRSREMGKKSSPSQLLNSISNFEKIAITSKGDSLSSELDNHFGRCSYFVILDKRKNKIDFLKNPYKTMDKNVGHLATQLMINSGIKKVISGDFGIKVQPLLTEAEIQMILIKNKVITIKEIVTLLNTEK